MEMEIQKKASFDGMELVEARLEVQCNPNRNQSGLGGLEASEIQ